MRTNERSQERVELLSIPLTRTLRLRTIYRVLALHYTRTAETALPTLSMKLG
jgi:hypothetical protein